ncbi:MAG: hypothetical protein LIP02_10535 [Bacteroidales bacterium]|nr:hypothetical protein [Bacteroidales bacterium]
MCKFNEAQYKYALQRIEDLIDVVPDCEPTASPEAMELSIMSEIVMEYEDEHFSMADDMAQYAPVA